MPIGTLTFVAAELHLCDVFAQGPLSGNSLAVVVSQQELAADVRQALTRELRHFESVFLVPTGDSEFAVHIHDLRRELAFAGHPLLGAGAVLHARSGRAAPCSWQLQLGERTVEVRSSAAGAERYLAAMDQGPPSFQRVLRDSERVAAAEAFSLPASALAGDLPAEVVSTGLRYLIVPLRGEIESAAIAHPALQELLAEVGADFAYLLDVESREGRTWENDGSLEDIATGSAAGPVGAYLVRHGRAQAGEPIVVQQGRFVGRPSKLNVLVHCRSDEPSNVEVSGPVVLIANGTFAISALA